MGKLQSRVTRIIVRWRRQACRISHSTVCADRSARFQSGLKFLLASSPKSKNINPRQSLRSTIGAALLIYYACGMTRLRRGC
ncbi:phage integrase domain protein [Burkholderia pseudomallei A79D]|nr:phage integrase domain protein [Burkholderia pseudomallei A79D]KGX96939.1 phage integrase domain protein [Burkholderia pseudomallei A79C]